jgi:hypothetical protein
MIRIGRDHGCLPHEVAERCPEDWFQALTGYYSYEAYMHERAERQANMRGGR